MIYSSEQYLDDCLRLRGGIAPDEHTNRAVREVLSDLAAARREVETVTRERDEANQKLANLIPMPTERMPADREWAHSEWACNQWYLANEAAMHYKAERDTVQQDLATSRAALEDVRRNNAVLREALDEAMGFLPASAPDACPECSHRSCERRRLELKSVREQIAMAQSLKETCRALAQEAGDAAK